MAKNNYMLGADPEMFVRDINTKQIVPICGKVGGTKGIPTPYVSHAATAAKMQWYNKSWNNEFKYLEDNVAFEFNVPPAAAAELFNETINVALVGAGLILKDAGLAPVYDRSSIRFAASALEHPGAQTIGCDPDIHAYGKDYEPQARPPFSIQDLGLWRHCGGHLHFSYDKEKIPDHVFVQLVDVLVYYPIVFKDLQRARRKFYGLAGLYRSKNYGIEYRSMSNFWLRNPAAVAYPAITLLQDVRHQINELNNFYSSIPNKLLDTVRNDIDKGVTQRSVVLEIRELAERCRLKSTEYIPVHSERTYKVKEEAVA